MWARAACALGLVVVLAGCGGNDLVVGGMLPPTLTPPNTTPTPCVASGGLCQLASDCCNGSCDFFSGVCN